MASEDPQAARGRPHEDGQSGMWSLVHHDGWYIVTGVWDLPADLPHERMPRVPDMQLELLRGGTWSPVKRAGRTGGTGAGGLVAVFVYEADGEGEDYRFTPMPAPS